MSDEVILNSFFCRDLVVFYRRVVILRDSEILSPTSSGGELLESFVVRSIFAPGSCLFDATEMLLFARQECLSLVFSLILSREMILDIEMAKFVNCFYYFFVWFGAFHGKSKLLSETKQDTSSPPSKCFTKV